ncbi:MAG: ketopantoate reductase family protein [Halanaeroarchaeum sp.]
MHVAVVGAGAIGSLFAAEVSRVATVTLVGREGDHLDAVRERGVTLERGDETVTASLRATSDHRAVRGADWLLLAVKSYDTASAMADVASHLDATPILTLQNGLGNAETIDRVAPGCPIVVGTTAHGAYVSSPGVVRHTGRGETVIGEYDDGGPAPANTIAGVLEEAGFEPTVTRTPMDAVWEKVLVNAGINPPTALAEVTNGRLIEDESGAAVVVAAIEEGRDVAAAAGRDVSADLTRRARSIARRTATNRSSMLQDLRSGSRTEIEAINGAIVERGDALGVDTPVNRTLANLVRLATDAG